jgi:hypothetical protein
LAGKGWSLWIPRVSLVQSGLAACQLSLRVCPPSTVPFASAPGGERKSRFLILRRAWTLVNWSEVGSRTGKVKFFGRWIFRFPRLTSDDTPFVPPTKYMQQHTRIEDAIWPSHIELNIIIIIMAFFFSFHGSVRFLHSRKLEQSSNGRLV